MSRVPELARADVPSEQLESYDTVIAANGGGKLAGPNTAIIHSPVMAAKRAALSEFMRSGIDASPRVLEVAILAAARALDGSYVWNAHAGFARKAGVSDAMIAAIRDGGTLPAEPADEAAIARYGRELCGPPHRVSDATYQAALAQFGLQRLVELTGLMGHYAMNIWMTNAFEVDVPDGAEELPV